jgi:hypothetical protein
MSYLIFTVSIKRCEITRWFKHYGLMNEWGSNFEAVWTRARAMHCRIVIFIRHMLKLFVTQMSICNDVCLCIINEDWLVLWRTKMQQARVNRLYIYIYTHTHTHTFYCQIKSTYSNDTLFCSLTCQRYVDFIVLGIGSYNFPTYRN